MSDDGRRAWYHSHRFCPKCGGGTEQTCIGIISTGGEPFRDDSNRATCEHRRTCGWRGKVSECVGAGHKPGDYPWRSHIHAFADKLNAERISALAQIGGRRFHFGISFAGARPRAELEAAADALVFTLNQTSPDGRGTQEWKGSDILTFAPVAP